MLTCTLVHTLILLCSVTLIAARTTSEKCPPKVTTDEVGACDPVIGRDKDAGDILAYTCYMKSNGNSDVTCPEFERKGKHYDIQQSEDQISSSQLDPETNKVIEFNYKLCYYQKICLGDNKRNPFCALHDYINPSDAYDATKCPSDLDPFHLTMIRQYFNVTQQNVKHLHEKRIGGDLNFMHYGANYYPQWVLSYYEEQNVLLLFFQPSDAYRIPDFVAALDITHKGYILNGKKIHFLGGVAKIMNDAVQLHDLLLLDLEYVFKKYNIFGQKKQDLEFVISGYSLGGTYAPYFFLSLYGEMENYIGGYAKEIVGTYLPQQLDKVSVIIVASPLIVYHKDVDEIPIRLRNRIFSIMVGMDPIPMLWSGKNPLHVAGEHILSGVKKFKFLFDVKHRLKFGTNAAVGTHQYVLSFASLQNKEFNNIQKMDKIAIETHLLNGGRCLWDTKYLSKSFTEAAIKDFLNYHAKQYNPLLDASGCLRPDDLKRIKRTTYDIPFCKPKDVSKREKGVSISKCYNYDGEKGKGTDFIDEEQCDCYKGHGIWKHFTEGLSRLQIGQETGNKLHNSKVVKETRQSKLLKKMGFK